MEIDGNGKNENKSNHKQLAISKKKIIEQTINRKIKNSWTLNQFNVEWMAIPTT